MDFFKLIRALEELIYEVSIWVLLIPKTFAKVVLNPGWAVKYITSELIKPPDERFDEFVSPVILWAVIAVLPYYWIASPLLKVLPMQGLGNTLSFLGLFLISYPLGFSVGILAASKETISKSKLKPVFYIQCYIFTPAYIALVPILLSLTTPNIEVFQLPVFRILASGITGLWFIVSETVIIFRTLNCGKVKSLLMFAVLFFASHMFFIGISTALIIGIQLVSN